MLLAMVALSGCGNSAETSGEDPSPEPSVDDDQPSSAAIVENSESPEDELPDQSVNIPEEWVTRTSDAWPDSQGFAQHAPVQELTGECLLFDQEPGFFDEHAQFRFSGFGSFGRPTTNYGNEPSSEDSYRYLCSLTRADELSAEDGPSWSPSAQLMVTDSTAHAEQTVEAFLDQPDLPEQTSTQWNESFPPIPATAVNWRPSSTTRRPGRS